MIAPADRPSPRPEWIDDKLVAETQNVWSVFYGRALTIAEALEILQSVGRLLDAIQD